MTPTLSEDFVQGLAEGRYNFPELECSAYLGHRSGYVHPDTKRYLGKPICETTLYGFKFNFDNVDITWDPVKQAGDAIVIKADKVFVGYFPLSPPFGPGDSVSLDWSSPQKRLDKLLGPVRELLKRLFK